LVSVRREKRGFSAQIITDLPKFISRGGGGQVSPSPGSYAYVLKSTCNVIILTIVYILLFWLVLLTFLTPGL